MDLLSTQPTPNGDDAQADQNAEKTLEVLGRTFPSAAAACREFGVNTATFYARVYAGWPPEQALGVTPHASKQGMAVEVEVAGVKFPSQREACDAYGVKLATFNYRKATGRSIEECLGITTDASLSRRGTPLVVAGQSYVSHVAAAKAHGIKAGLLKTRLKAGRSLEEALGLVPLKALERKRAVRVTPEEKAAGVFYVQGIRFDPNESRPPRPSRESAPISVAGVAYLSLTDAAQAYGLDRSVVFRRIKRGWTIDEAFGLTRRERVAHSPRPLQVGGKHYPSLKAALQAHPISEEVVRRRLDQGLSPEQAFGLTVGD